MSGFRRKALRAAEEADRRAAEHKAEEEAALARNHAERVQPLLDAAQAGVHAWADALGAGRVKFVQLTWHPESRREFYNSYQVVRPHVYVSFTCQGVPLVALCDLDDGQPFALGGPGQDATNSRHTVLDLEGLGRMIRNRKQDRKRRR